MLVETYNTIRALVPCSTRATKQWSRFTAAWLNAALPRRTLPMKQIPDRFLLPMYASDLAEFTRPHSAPVPGWSSCASTSVVAHLHAPLPRVASSCRTLATTSAVDVSVQPIIVAASWLGAKKGPFSKYKQLWSSLGFSNILAARPPMTSIMVPAAGQLYAANFTHKLLQHARKYPTAPILVHLFSGGGFIFMGWVFQLLSEVEGGQAVLNRVCGVILDSSPANVTADVSSRAIVAAALGRPANNIEQELPWLVKPTAAVVDTYLRLPFIKDALVGMEDTWLSQAPACPKLFLYSDADVLTGTGVVEQFMLQQQAKGSETYSYKWRDSAHVDHYRKYPQEYKEQLMKFVDKVLGDGTSSDSAAAAAAAIPAAVVPDSSGDGMV